MWYLIFKYCITAGIIVFVSETAKRNDKIGALITSLPIVTDGCTLKKVFLIK